MRLTLCLGGWFPAVRFLGFSWVLIGSVGVGHVKKISVGGFVGALFAVLKGNQPKTWHPQNNQTPYNELLSTWTPQLFVSHPYYVESPKCVRSVPILPSA